MKELDVGDDEKICNSLASYFTKNHFLAIISKSGSYAIRFLFISHF